MPYSGDLQVEYWNDPAVAEDLRSRQSGVTDFAREVLDRVPARSRILEIGCGAGDDAAFFAQHGHDVIATDVSHPLVDIAAQRFADIPNVTFRQADVTAPFAMGSQSCDVVYARLSLQYFDDKTTMSIFGEIAWTLRPGGQFFFACRSTEDPLYGKGTQLEPDYFEFEGHTRRFFSPEYATELLTANGFSKIEVETGTQKLYGRPSAYVKCAAVHI